MKFLSICVLILIIGSIVIAGCTISDEEKYQKITVVNKFQTGTSLFDSKFYIEDSTGRIHRVFQDAYTMVWPGNTYVLRYGSFTGIILEGDVDGYVEVIK